MDTLSRREIMSQGFGVIPKKVMRDKRLKPEAKAIYAYLCSFAGNESVAYPSVSLMCEELGMGIERFYKHRNQLEELGYIKVHRMKEGNRFAKNVYILCDGDFTDTESSFTENQYTENQEANKNSSNKNSSTSNRKNKNNRGFVPPTRNELADYIREMGYGVDPDEFLDYNESVGWTLKGGQKVKDWKARVRTFERNRRARTGEAKKEENRRRFEDIPDEELPPGLRGVFNR